MIVGQRIRRPDAPDKVKGSALYIEDLAFAGALVGGRPALARTRTRASRASTSSAARDRPRRARRAHRRRHPGQEPHPDDPGRLAGPRRGRACATSGEAVALVAAEDPRGARGRAWPRSWSNTSRCRPCSTWRRRSPRARSSRTGRSGAARRRSRCARTDVVVVEGTYHTPYQEHAYIEPNGMIAMPDGAGRGRATARCSAPSTCRRRWPPPSAATSTARASCRR